MNERIIELAEQAGFNLGRFDVGSASLLSQRIERFAELVRQDEREQAEKQEPVAYKYTDKTNPLVFYFTTHKDSLPNPDVIETELYTAPPKREIDMSTKPENIDTSEERVHETDKSIHEPVTTIETACALLRQAHDVLSMSSLPPKREWVGLTEKEIDAIGYKYGAGGLDLMDELLAMLKEKNT